VNKTNAGGFKGSAHEVHEDFYCQTQTPATDQSQPAQEKVLRAAKENERERGLAGESYQSQSQKGPPQGKLTDTIMQALKRQ
jgi:hypothetical protein